MGEPERGEGKATGARSGNSEHMRGTWFQTRVSDGGHSRMYGRHRNLFTCFPTIELAEVIHTIGPALCISS